MRAVLPDGPFTKYQALAVATVGLTLALIAVGAIVRTTGSGLGCPDWPLCHGRLIPPAERTAIIEYSHRSLAAVVGLLIVATSAATLLTRRADRSARILAVIALPLLALQAWFGKVTVERELPPEVVAIHLATALTLLGILSVIAAFAILGEQRERIVSTERDRFLRNTMIVVAGIAAILLGGAYVVGSGSTAACTTWPGCAEAPVPFVDGAREQAIHWAHRLSVLVGLAAVGWLVLSAEHLREPSEGLRFGVRTLAALYVLQIAIGGLNIWTQFSEAALVLHLAAGAAVWAVVVVLEVAGRFRPEPVRLPARAAGSTTPRGAQLGTRG